MWHRRLWSSSDSLKSLLVATLIFSMCRELNGEWFTLSLNDKSSDFNTRQQEFVRFLSINWTFPPGLRCCGNVLHIILFHFHQGYTNYAEKFSAARLAVESITRACRCARWGLLNRLIIAKRFKFDWVNIRTSRPKSMKYRTFSSRNEEILR